MHRYELQRSTRWVAADQCHLLLDLRVPDTCASVPSTRVGGFMRVPWSTSVAAGVDDRRWPRRLLPGPPCCDGTSLDRHLTMTHQRRTQRNRSGSSDPRPGSGRGRSIVHRLGAGSGSMHQLSTRRPSRNLSASVGPSDTRPHARRPGHSHTRHPRHGTDPQGVRHPEIGVEVGIGPLPPPPTCGSAAARSRVHRGHQDMVRPLLLGTSGLVRARTKNASRTGRTVNIFWRRSPIRRRLDARVWPRPVGARVRFPSIRGRSGSPLDGGGE